MAQAPAPPSGDGEAGGLPNAAPRHALSVAICHAGAAPARKTKSALHQQGNIHAD